MLDLKIHRILFHIFLFLIPIQTRILYRPEKAYVSWYFDYHLAFFLYLSDIILFTCLVSWLLFDKPKLELPRNKGLFLAVSSFVILCLITLFHVKRIDLGVYQTLKWVEFFAILLYMRLTYNSVREFEVSFLVLLVSGVFQGLLGWLQFHMQHIVGLKFLGEYISPIGTPGLANFQTAAGKVIRGYGTMPHPNVLAGFLILSLTIGLYFVSHGTKWIRKFAPFALFIVSMGIFVTFSRIGWIAAALAIIAFVSYYLWNNKKIAALTIIGVVLFSSATTLALYKNNLETRVNDNNSASIEDRYFFNTLGWGIVKKFPILGSGIGNYVLALQDLYELEPWQHQPSHNIFIFIAAELGIIGLGLFIWILFEIIRSRKKIFSDPLLFTIYCLLFTFLLMSQFDHYFVTIQQGRLVFAIVLGFIAALPNINKEKIAFARSPDFSRGRRSNLIMD